MWVANEASEWAQQCSKHLSHIEKRLMTSEFLGHEVVRMVQQIIDNFKPEPAGDWGYILRKLTDIAIQTMRRLSTIYRKNEPIEAFHVRAMALVRLYIEEAYHRLLEGIDHEDQVRKMGLCSMMITMKNIEAKTLGKDQSMGLHDLF